MRTSCRVVLMLSMFSAGLAPAATPAEDEASVIAFQHAACEAYKTNDVAGIEKYMDPSYELTDSKGNTTTRAMDIADARNRVTTYSEFRNHDMKIRLYGDTAVVVGITSIKGETAGEKFAIDVRFTDTMIRRDGQWRMVAGHVSRLAPQ
jgi:ketosteroid isomerase-like protein